MRQSAQIVLLNLSCQQLHTVQRLRLKRVPKLDESTELGPRTPATASRCRGCRPAFFSRGLSHLLSLH
eukprot:3513124-Pyramimonas_sp.AAC.1